MSEIRRYAVEFQLAGPGVHTFVDARGPKEAAEKLIGSTMFENKYKIVSFREEMNMWARISLLGGTRESVSYYGIIRA